MNGITRPIVLGFVESRNVHGLLPPKMKKRQVNVGGLRQYSHHVTDHAVIKIYQNRLVSKC